ncbi:MAG TPA: Ig domain-containing protein, partial [Solirubrobacteraceae bacterium]|nr:Ig domain-containing protein [Solirubrobacteraceae bacterium]
APTAQGASLVSVSCTSPGNCVAGGSYIDSALVTKGMLVTEANGVWGQATTSPPPTGTTAEDSIRSVTCTSPGNCLAVGDYSDALENSLAMYVIETGGVWGPPNQLALPSDAIPVTTGNEQASLQSVTCPADDSCVASGYYASSGGYQAMLATSTGGVFGPATAVALPGGAPMTGQDADLLSVTCTSPGNCVAAGFYSDSVSGQAMSVTEASGVWGTASQLTLPADAAGGAAQAAQLDSVTCPAPGRCVAAGSYTGANGSPGGRAMVASEADGAWGQAAGVALPSGAAGGAGPNAYLDSVTCTGAGACLAVGGYTDAAGGGQAMTLSSVPSLAVSTTSLAAAVAVAGVPYSATLTATGGTAKYGWSISAGLLPAGLRLNASTGLISGTPSAAVSGASRFTAAVSDSGPPAQQASVALSISVSAPRPATASLGALKVTSAKVAITVTCAGTALQRCTGRLLLTTIEHLTGHKVTAITAAKRKAKKSKRTVTAGKASYRVTGGRGITVTIALNATGKALLARFRKLPAELALTATGAKKVTATKAVAFKAKPKPKPKRKRKRKH